MSVNYQTPLSLELIEQSTSLCITCGLLSSAQFGFRKSHSTGTALLDCTNEWYMNIDKKLFNLGVFIDLKKTI